MSDQRETYQRVSVPEAAELLGVSVATVRRRIRDGSLQAETIHRPQGIAYAVLLPTDHEQRSPSDQQVGITAPLNRSEGMMATWSATVLAPIVAELAASRQVIATQAETIGQLRERLATVDASQRPQAGSGMAECPESPMPPDLFPAPISPTPNELLRSLRWWFLGLLAVFVLIGAGVLLTMR